jgi:endonuclease-8
MPEGDTIHRAARKIQAALAGREMAVADAPSPRSPIHSRSGELAGATLERAEARGKHLLLHFSGDRVIHSHLGMNGRWYVRVDGRLPRGRPWLVLASGRGVASQSGGKILRLVSASRARNDPALLQLGPDPLRPGFDPEAAAARVLAYDPAAGIGEALNDQSLIAGIGNVIRIEACFLPGVSPWRRVGDLSAEEARKLVDAAKWVMETSMARGSRPKQIYGRSRQPCPRCGGRIRVHGQGDDNRVTYWCEDCQR